MDMITRKEANTCRLTKTGTEIVLASENSESLAKAGEYQLEQNKFCHAYCLHVKDENCTFSLLSISKETIKSVSS